MFGEIEIPKPLYDYWPALCVCLACGYGLMGMPMMAGALILYAGWIWRQRLMY